MDDQLDYIKLVKKAQLGDKDSLDKLAESVGRQLHAYIYRITLQEEQTNDILQESLIDMFKLLDKLG